MKKIESLCQSGNLKIMFVPISTYEGMKHKCKIPPPSRYLVSIEQSDKAGKQQW